LLWNRVRQPSTDTYALGKLLGVHIGVYQPWYSQSLFINSRYYYDEYSCVNI